MAYIKHIYYFIFNYVYDAIKYLLFSTTFTTNSFKKIEGRLMANAHVIEKGLSFKNTRYRFGSKIISRLLDLVATYEKLEYPKSSFGFQSAVTALNDYRKFHKSQNVNLGILGKKIDKLLKDVSLNKSTAVQTIHRTDYFANKSFPDVIKNRRSVRRFESRAVKTSIIQNAIALALNSPSVCNRQSWRVSIIQNKTMIDSILDHQKGTRGFKNEISTLLAVTTELDSFQGFNERNQCFIDGGLFSMSLLLSLHYYELATCPLNWSYNFDSDIRVRKELKISNSEVIIMFIAVGVLPSSAVIPSSRKKRVLDTIRIVQ